MAEAEQHQQRLVTAWHTSFKKGTDYDLWGQPVEATSEYHRSHSLSFLLQNNLTSIYTQAALHFKTCLLNLSRSRERA